MMRPNGFAADGRLLAVGNIPDGVHLIDPRTGETAAVLPGKFLTPMSGGVWVTHTESGFVWPVAEAGGRMAVGPPQRSPFPVYHNHGGAVDPNGSRVVMNRPLPKGRSRSKRSTRPDPTGRSLV